MSSTNVSGAPATGGGAEYKRGTGRGVSGESHMFLTTRRQARARGGGAAARSAAAA